MTNIQLNYFLSVAQCGSFSGAARELYTSQPNISRQIAAPEDELMETLAAQLYPITLC